MAYLLKRYGAMGSCYQDSRVTDTFDDGADHTDDEFLLELLRSIHDDWNREHDDDDGESMFHYHFYGTSFTNI